MIYFLAMIKVSEPFYIYHQDTYLEDRYIYLYEPKVSVDSVPTEKTYILERELASGLYFYLLVHKDAWTSKYAIAKEHYGKRFGTPNKTYPVFDELEQLHLIKIKKSPIGGKEVDLVRPNLPEFLKVLSEKKLPADRQFDDLDIRRLTELLNKFDLARALGNLPRNADGSLRNDSYTKVAYTLVGDIRSLDILSAVAAILKFGGFLGTTTQVMSVKKFHYLLGTSENVLGNVYDLFQPFRSLPEDLTDKLQYLNIPTPIDGLMKSAQLLLGILENFKSPEFAKRVMKSTKMK